MKEADGRLISSCVCVVVPNLTRNGRPYALVENVVTRAGCRGKGHAAECLNRAGQIAAEAGCYKIMLMTGSKKEEVLVFYEKCGYCRGDKTAFVRWLE